MNNQTPTTTCACTHTQACAVCAASKDVPWELIEPTAPPAEQTATTPQAYVCNLLNYPQSIVNETEVFHLPFGTLTQIAEEYADLRCKELLEAAAKELPTFRRLSFLHFLDREGSERDEVERFWVKYFEDGCIKMSEQAAPIIAALKESKIRADRRLVELEHEKAVLHSRVRELEELNDKQVKIIKELHQEHGANLIFIGKLEMAIRKYLQKSTTNLNALHKVLTPPSEK